MLKVEKIYTNQDICDIIIVIFMEKIKTSLINKKYREVVFELLSMLRSHSEESYIHSVDVANKSHALAIVFNIGGEELERLYTASLLHDIGKLCVEKKILHNQNATIEERDTIRFEHIEGTKNILSEYFDDDFVRLAVHHHERLNCSGYPEHLNAKKLDILDRILQVADVTSALEMPRCYKDAYDEKQVTDILDNLVKKGELDKRCVKEIEKILYNHSKDKIQKNL